MKTGNKGEWSEAYTFVKLIGDGKVYASDEDLKKINNKFYPILKVFKEGIDRYYDIDSKEGKVNIIGSDGNIISSLKSSDFISVAKKTLECIQDKTGVFEIPFLEEFLNDLGIEKIKASSKTKTDIEMEILDVTLQKPCKCTFSIKSDFKSKPTILNASGRTNFSFLIDGVSENRRVYYNNLFRSNGNPDLKGRFGEIYEEWQKGNYIIEFVDEKDNIFYQNLRLIDSNLPNILAFLLLYHYSHGKESSIVFLTEKLIEYNPLNLSDSEKNLFYKKKIHDFLRAVTFGMMPGEPWDGSYEITGGLLTVKKDGEILCHHIFYDNNSLNNYLFKNTKLESPSTSKFKYGDVKKLNTIPLKYSINSKNNFDSNNRTTYFKLNLQLRLY